YSADGQAFAGGIAGRNIEGLITLCSATGEVKAESSRASSANEGRADAGGIAGSNIGSTISYSYADGAVTASATGNNNSNARAGGIAGHNAADTGAGFPVRSAALITDCYSTGDVTATEGKKEARAGGIAGQNVSNQSARAATVRRCYSTGNISASGSGQSVRAGGIIGVNSGDTGPGGEAGSVIVEYCYAAGNIEATTSSYCNVGGIAGLNFGLNGKVQYSAALNRQITNSGGGGFTVQRIAQNDQSVLNKNIAWNGMKLNGVTVSGGGQDFYGGKDGKSTTTAELTEGHTVWEDLFGASNFGIGSGKPWKWVEGYPYPALQWQTSVPSVPTLEP
ncbi:MAG: hypothetical protein LBK44_07200, partial [Spirochaetales bacterium]|nr:hypothetical protein [Spirochaetales bacterium]